MKTKSHKLRKAFSLMEVLLAVFLTGAVGAILAATMPVATASRVRADMNNKATSLAQQQMEAIRGAGYANLAPDKLVTATLIDSTSPVSANKYRFTNNANTQRDNPANILPAGKGYVTITQYSTDVKEVVVEVEYSDRGTTRTIRLATLVANL